MITNNNFYDQILGLIAILFFIAVAWFGVAMFLQAMMCPELTNTQLFLHSLNSFILDWHEC